MGSNTACLIVFLSLVIVFFVFYKDGQVFWAKRLFGAEADSFELTLAFLLPYATLSTLLQSDWFTIAEFIRCERNNLAVRDRYGVMRRIGVFRLPYCIEGRTVLIYLKEYWRCENPDETRLCYIEFKSLPALFSWAHIFEKKYSH